MGIEARHVTCIVGGTIRHHPLTDGLVSRRAGANDPTYRPEAGWSEVSPQRRDDSVLRPTGATAAGLRAHNAARGLTQVWYRCYSAITDHDA